MKKILFVLYILLLQISATAQVKTDSESIDIKYQKIQTLVKSIGFRMEQLGSEKDYGEQKNYFDCIPSDAQEIVVHKKDGTKLNIPLEQIDRVSIYDVEGERLVSCGGDVVFKEGKNKTFTVNGVSFNMVAVKAGSFQMGSSTGRGNEQPVHQVTLTQDYYIGETEVTQALWKAVTGYTPTSDGKQWSSGYGLGDEYPAYYISYEDVQSFIAKLNSKTGQSFRMPTEAEWEYAARGGNKSIGFRYSGSNNLNHVAWYDDITSIKHPVKMKNPNELGIYDMSGNVCEWCGDWYYDTYYSTSPSINPLGPETGSNRVYRGGAYFNKSTYCLVTYRSGDAPNYRDYKTGFRLVLYPSK